MLCCLSSTSNRPEFVLKKIALITVSSLLLAACNTQDPTEALTNKCVEDGLKLEGCTCMVSMMEKFLPPEDLKDLAKIARTKSSPDSEAEMNKLMDAVERKMKTHLESLPVKERLKKGAAVAVDTAECTPKFF